MVSIILSCYNSFSTIFNEIYPLSFLARRWNTTMICGLKKYRSYDATKVLSTFKGGMMKTDPEDNSSFARLNQRLSALSLQPHEVGGNGDCFFKSISHEIIISDDIDKPDVGPPPDNPFENIVYDKSTEMSSFLPVGEQQQQELDAILGISSQVMNQCLGLVLRNSH